MAIGGGTDAGLAIRRNPPREASTIQLLPPPAVRVRPRAKERVIGGVAMRRYEREEGRREYIERRKSHRWCGNA